MKRIVLCFDGTWQSVDDADSVSNVVRVAQAVLPVTPEGVQQTVYYQAGVGSNGGIDRMADAPVERSHDGRTEWVYLNEKVHWSVIERCGRVAVVDETKYAKYAPRNMKLPVPEDRIAAQTPKEEELIAACRSSPQNNRRTNCVLHRQIGAKPNRRMRRIAALQKMWSDPVGTGGRH